MIAEPKPLPQRPAPSGGNTIELPAQKPGENDNKNKGAGGRGFKAWYRRHRDGPVVNLVFSAVIPLVFMLTAEWIARTSFETSMAVYFPAFLLSYMLLVCLYVALSQLTGLHALATGLLGVCCNVLALVSHYKLTMRNEPFLPWDFTQIEDLLSVSGELSFSLPPRVWVVLGLVLLLTVVAAFVRVPRGQNGKSDLLSRLIAGGTALVCGCFLVFFIFLNPHGTEAMGMKLDMWRHKGNLQSYGVVTSFIANFQMVAVEKPDGYSGAAVDEILAETRQNEGGPLYESSFAAGGGTAEQPDIFYIMGEAFWDVTELDGIVYDRDLLPNLTALKEVAAYGNNFSPSYGGGTCDVEFEALTGYSMEYLPAGSKPFQAHITDDTMALPWHLKEQGYQTLAIHGYGRRFWNRDVAYPRLGIDDFISEESPQLKGAPRRRGLISDEAMMDCIISEYEARKADGPVFIHTVTIQNHSTYDANRYADSERVKVLSAPPTLPEKAIGQLEDCATAIYEMDAALGKLVAYLEQSDRPAIIVFWGDHKNGVASDYSLFEQTGFIQPGDTDSPRLQETPLLIWSNFSDDKVELGNLSSYNITPVMLDLYGLEKPAMFDFLAQQVPLLHGRTRGYTIMPDGTYATELTEAQQESARKHAILQYDSLFGEKKLGP